MFGKDRPKHAWDNVSKLTNLADLTSRRNDSIFYSAGRQRFQDVRNRDQSARSPEVRSKDDARVNLRE